LTEALSPGIIDVGVNDAETVGVLVLLVFIATCAKTLVLDISSVPVFLISKNTVVFPCSPVIALMLVTVKLRKLSASSFWIVLFSSAARDSRLVMLELYVELRIEMALLSEFTFVSSPENCS